MHLNRKVNRPLVGRCAQDPVEAQGLTAVQPLVAADGFAVRRAYMLTSSFVAAKLPLWVGTESSRTIEAATQAAHTPNRNVGQLCFLQLPFTPATAAGSNVCLLVAIAIWSVECDRLVQLQSPQNQNARSPGRFHFHFHSARTPHLSLSSQGPCAPAPPSLRDHRNHIDLHQPLRLTKPCDHKPS